eukprot:3180518-Prymnesium_polylepis.1
MLFVHVVADYKSAGRSNSLRGDRPTPNYLSNAAVLRCANVARSPHWRSGRAVDGRCGAFFGRVIHVDMPDPGAAPSFAVSTLPDRADIVRQQPHESREVEARRSEAGTSNSARSHGSFGPPRVDPHLEWVDPPR